MSKMTTQHANSNLVMLISILAMCVVFAVDSHIPLGVAGGVPHIIPILISLWAKNIRFTLILAVLCSLFTVIAYFSSPSGGELWKVLFNRGIALLAIWSCALLTIKYFNELIKHTALEKELEKISVYRETISGVNHLVRNLQSNFLIINHSPNLKHDLGEEVIEALNQSSREVCEILDKLGDLDEVTPEVISEIAYSNVNESK
ncbi:hypothetical protein L1286_13515 [Pseudoalteromonas sp. SMS1]|nr:hypothetical protein [Pseudoalteromonas sp. SMS1]